LACCWLRQVVKFLLVIQICSVTAMECIPPQEQTPLFHSHYDCATAGYLRSMKILDEIGGETVDQTKTQINFTCVETNDT